ncbi:hypothetical protein GQR58_025304 [Nymphon striatum]|nr:hypothetical protein GQR58_025304 [Nymphon striatum]
MTTLSLKLRALKGHLTRSQKEFNKLAVFVEASPSPRGISELEAAFSKNKQALAKVENTIEEIMNVEEDEAQIDYYNNLLMEYSSTLNDSTQHILSIIQNNNFDRQASTNSIVIPVPAKPKICDTLKPFQLNNKNTPSDLRSWIGKFKVYHSTSGMDSYSAEEQHMFLFSCVNFNLETKIRENDIYKPELNIFGDNGVIQILQEEFDLGFPLFNRRLDLFRYRQTPGQKFTDFMVNLKQKEKKPTFIMVMVIWSHQHRKWAI